MNSDFSILPGSSGIFPPPPPQSAAQRAGFSGVPGVARLNLPPHWCHVAGAARLVMGNPSDAWRAQAADPNRAMPTPPRSPAGTSAFAAQDAAAPASSPAGPEAGSAAAMAGATATESVTVMAEGSCSAAELCHWFNATPPGVQAYVAMVPGQLRMGRAPYVDLNGTRRAPIGNISETETVWNAGIVLADALTRPIPREGDLPVSRYFDGYTLEVAPSMDQIPALLARKEADTQLLANFLAGLDASPTFRLLVRQAVDRGELTLSGVDRWAVTMASPREYRGGVALYGPFGLDRARRLLVLPLRDAQPVGNHLYLFKGGFLLPMSPHCHAVRTMVAALSGASPLNPDAWRGDDGRLDPGRVAALGAGERGVVDYLSQRILGELGLSDYRWLSPLPFTEAVMVTPPGSPASLWRLPDAMQQAFDAIGGVNAVEQYVEWQDAYLRGQYPIG